MNIDIENQSVISDITELNDNITISSDEIQQKLDQIRELTEIKLNELTIDGLKDKCKEIGLVGVSKYKKPELVTALLTEFLKLWCLLKDKKTNELKNICKQFNIKGIAGFKKDEIAWSILQHCSRNLLFQLDETIISNNETKPKTKTSELENPSQKMSLIEELEQQKLEIEIKMKEELAKKQRAEEELAKKQRAEEELAKKQKAEEEIQRVKMEEEQKRLEEEKKKEKEDAKKKKQSIPKQVRIIVWNHYIGEDIIKHKCLCCKKVTITNTNFDVGHVLSEKNGGTHEINNLRPICGACNHSMGAENMIDFVVKYGLYIG